MLNQVRKKNERTRKFNRVNNRGIPPEIEVVLEAADYALMRLKAIQLSPKAKLCQCYRISLCHLCVLCVSMVVVSCIPITTETQRTQRLHREDKKQ